MSTPARDSAPASASRLEPSALGSSLRSRTVLIIDDDASVLSAVQSTLEREGMRVVATNDPASAMHTAVRVQPDLILCDISMQGLDGFQVLRLLQSNPLSAVYPVVFLTARSSLDDKILGFQSGIVDWICKPLMGSTLIARLRKIFERLGTAAREVRGQIEETSIEEMLNLLRDHRRSGVLEIEAEGLSASILLRDGEVLEVRCGQLTLVSALNRVLELNEGAFLFRTAEEPASGPRRAPRLSAPAERLALDAEVSGLRPEHVSILLIDDEPIAIQMFRNILEKQGFKVQTAATGLEGLQKARELNPSLIISDVGLPDIEGWKLCAEVRQSPALRSTPFIFLSARNSYRGSIKALAMGADDYLPKTIPIAEFLLRIQTVLQRSAELRLKVEDPSSTSISGLIQDFSVVEVLERLAQSDRSGVFLARSAHSSATIRLRQGEVLSASVHGLLELDGMAAFHHLLSWDSGTFEFFAGEVGSSGQMRRPVGELLAEGCRLLEEKRQGIEALVLRADSRVWKHPRLADIDSYADTLAQENLMLLKAIGERTSVRDLLQILPSPPKLQSLLRYLAVQGIVVIAPPAPPGPPRAAAP